MDVFIMIKRKKTTIFLDAKEDTKIEELKKMIEGITKVLPQNQHLYNDNEVMMPKRTLLDYGIISSTALAQTPATLGLAYKNTETGDFEELDITPLSIPPELPDVLKPSFSDTQQVPSGSDTQQVPSGSDTQQVPSGSDT